MNKSDVTKTLKAFIASELLDGDDGDLDETTPLLELNLLNSFSIISLLAFFESEFDLEIPLESVPIDRLKHLDSMADLVLESERSGRVGSDHHP